MVRKMAQETLEKFEGENKENNFKQTEIGLIPEDWEVVRFEGSILKRRIKVGKIKQQEYKKFGKYPVIDQSQNYIAGFCDDDEKVYRGELPVIIFGDHTRVFKFVNFPFVVGADGVKVLIPNKEIYDPKFLFYAMLTLNIPSRGYNRHYKLLREKELPFPPLSEQRKIAKVLDKIQQAIELQDRIIEQAKNLKKSLMQKLFTEGLYGEGQKETEIGLIPKSWEMVRLGEIARFKNGINFIKEQKGNKGILTIDVFNMYSENIYLDIKETNLYRVNLKVNSDYLLRPGDILFVRSSLKREGVGWASLFNGYDEPVTFCGFIIRARLLDKQEILPEFVTYFFRGDIARREFMAGSEQVAITNINQGRLKSFKIPLPPLPEQKQIAHILSVVDEKIEVEQKRKQVLKELFKTVLHKLMSGEIRLKEVEI